MFTGRYEPIAGSGELATPTSGESMTASFKSNWLEPFLVSPDMSETKSKELSDRTTALQIESNKAQGIVQRGADWLAGMAGSILNPLSLAAGGVAGLAVKPLIGVGAGLIGRYLPSEGAALLSKPLSEIAGRTLPIVGKESAGSLTGKAVSGYAQATGFSLPQDVASTYDAKTDSFNWHGGIKASFADGGVGLALMPAPYLAGSIWRKLFGKGADHTKMPLPGEKVEGFNESHIDEAIANKQLSPEKGQWFKDYIFQGDTNENVAKRATQMLIKDGQPVDSATNQVMFKILHPDDVNNFQIAVADKMASNLPDNIRTLYQDFIGHSRMDNMRADPNALSTIDGLKGVVSFVRKRLESAPNEIELFKKKLNELLPNDLNHEKEDSFFSQKSILKNMKKVGYEESHVKQLPITVPENIKRHIKIKEKISTFNSKLKQQERKFKKKVYFHGRPLVKTPMDHIANIDEEFGKGYWYTESEAHAKHYGEKIVKAEGNYKIFDVDKTHDPELKVIYEKIKHENKKHTINNLSEKSQALTEQLRKRAIEKGYDGLLRREGRVDKYGLRTRVGGIVKAKPEIMFFKRPESSTKDYEPNKQTLRRIEELKSKLPKILTMKQEIANLRDKLLPKVKEDNFKLSPEYRRLLDLTHVRKDARELFHELNLRNEYELHEAYATMLDTITKVMRSEFGKLAKPENINDYMRERIQASVPEFKNLEIAAVKKEVSDSRKKLDKATEDLKTKGDQDRAIDALDQEMEETSSSKNKEEYDEIKNQYNEFKESGNVFSNLIKCVLGASNV